MPKNNQIIFYVVVVVITALLCIFDKIDSNQAMLVITSTLTYVAGRFTPYQEGDLKNYGNNR